MALSNYTNLVLGVSIAVLACGAHARSQPSSPDVVAGGRLAQEYCGACHAVGGSGGSPLPNAPPFRDLFKRYRRGHLGHLLHEGMLAPTHLPEEGSAHHHPKMPMATLGDDQIAELTAYLQHLDLIGRARGRE
jgi:cytochrome c